MITQKLNTTWLVLWWMGMDHKQCAGPDIFGQFFVLSIDMKQGKKQNNYSLHKIDPSVLSSQAASLFVRPG